MSLLATAGTIVSAGMTGAQVGGGLWGQNPPSSETDIQGEVQDPIQRESLLAMMDPGQGGGGNGGDQSSNLFPLLALGGLAAFILISEG